MSNQCNDETAKIKTKQTMQDFNKMEGSYNLAWFNYGISGKSNIWSATTFLDGFTGKVEIGTLISDGVKGKLFIKGYPSNKMEGSFGIQAYPRESFKFSPVEDTFVSEKQKSLSFGEYPYIRVGRDKEGFRYRSFIKFDISKMPLNCHVTRASLTLYSQDKKAFEGLEINSADRNWIENSITWNGHPQRKKLISIEQVEEGLFKYTFDVKSIAKDWYYNVERNYGFLLKAFDEEQVQFKSFLSKEYSNRLYAPELEIEVFDPDTFILPADRIDGKANIESIQKAYKGIEGKAYIDKDEMYSKIRAKARIYPDMIEGIVKISKANDSLRAKSVIRNFDEKLQGKVEIIHDIIDEQLRGKAIISQTAIKGRVRIAYTRRIKGKANIQTFNDNLQGISNIIGGWKYRINGKASIRNIDDIYGKVKITSLDKDDNLKGTASIIKSNDTLRGTVKVRYANEKLEGKAFIAKSSKIDGKIRVKVRKEIFSGKALIRYTDEKLHGGANIIAFKTIDGKAIIQIKKQLFKGKAHIAKQKNIFEGKAIISQIQIGGKALILVKDDNLRGKAIIPIQKDLKGKATIREFSYIKGKASITSLEFSEIYGAAIIKNENLDEDTAYGFIM